MRRRIKAMTLLLALSLCVMVATSGCSSIQKKFTRKKKGREKPPQIYHVQDYNITPSMELYTTHYIYWKNWHRQILDTLGDNTKNDKRCIEEMISNLISMKEMLADEKGDKLDKHILRLKNIESDIKNQNLTDQTKTRIRRTLEKEFKLIKVEFSYRKVGKYLRPEFRREAVPETEAEDNKGSV